MDLKDIVLIPSVIVTFLISCYSLYKAFKVTPKEIKVIDVDLSTKYANLLDRSLERAEEANERLKKEAEKTASFEIKLKELKIINDEKDEKILILDVKVIELERKINKQEVELIELRNKVLRG